MKEWAFPAYSINIGKTVSKNCKEGLQQQQQQQQYAKIEYQNRFWKIKASNLDWSVASKSKSNHKGKLNIDEDVLAWI